MTKAIVITPKAGATRAGQHRVLPFTLERADLRNLTFLLLCFAAVLVFIPPVRAFSMDDDWAYIQSVQRMLAGTYRPHEWAQPTSLGSIGWGGALSSIFGFSLTFLTVQTLVMSALCLVLLYALLRQMKVSPNRALLGTACLGLNPLYIYLSYTYMTECSVPDVYIGEPALLCALV